MGLCRVSAAADQRSPHPVRDLQSPLQLCQSLLGLRRALTGPGQESKKGWRDENVPTDLREAAQTHVEGDKVAAAYGGQAKMLARRRDLAERWARFCAGPTEATVIPLPLSRVAEL
jgi:hypothetical protein